MLQKLLFDQVHVFSYGKNLFSFMHVLMWFKMFCISYLGRIYLRK